jgi:transposase-like protein
MLGRAGRTQQPMIATAIRQIFPAASADESREQLIAVADQLRALSPKVARVREDAAEDLPAFC